MVVALAARRSQGTSRLACGSPLVLHHSLILQLVGLGHGGQVDPSILHIVLFRPIHGEAIGALLLDRAHEGLPYVCHVLQEACLLLHRRLENVQFVLDAADRGLGRRRERAGVPGLVEGDQGNKRELKALNKIWQSCHSRSVYHTDPVPEFQDE